MSRRVIVYGLVADGESPQTGRLFSLFSDSLFDNHFLELSPPESLVGGSQDEIEKYRFNWCLQEAAKMYPDSYVIIAKDTSISNSSPAYVANVVSAAMKDNTWDICYLSKWMDQCQLQTNKVPIAGTMTTLAQTVNPSGTQALLFSPRGRDLVLGTLPLKDGRKFPEGQGSLEEMLKTQVHKGNLVATTTNPNLIVFDLNQAKKETDYQKVNECAPIAGAATASAASSAASGVKVVDLSKIPVVEKNLADVTINRGMSGWWWLLLLLIVLAIFGAIWYLHRRGTITLPSFRY